MHWLEKYLIPPSCQLCGSSADDEELCHHCATSVRAVGYACPLCALPNDDGSVCQSCTHHPPVWQGVQSLFVYDGAIRELMHLWKYQKRRSAGRVLHDRLAQWLLHHRLPEVDGVVSIPMHRNKLAKRGFNTAYELARVVARYQQIPLLNRVLVRQFETPAQAGLSKQERQSNLVGAFRVEVDRLIGYRRVLLVDDVLTTGATLTACTQLLISAGVVEVYLVTLARALPPEPEHP